MDPKSTQAPLLSSFYDRDPAIVARELLGAVVLVNDGEVTVGGRVVETEAYLGPNDLACHATAGRTARTWHLFGPPGNAYVYRSYGLHWCLNAVTREDGFGSAVLIRALEPIEGVEIMRARRPKARADYELCNGPGKLCDALDIDRRFDGSPLTGAGALSIFSGDAVGDQNVLVGERIGITKDVGLLLRFWIAGARVPRSRSGKQLGR